MTDFGFGAAGSSVASSVKSGVGNLNATGVSIGGNFSLGIARGITAGTGFIRTAARNAALAARQAAQAALQVASPSRVGKQIGGFFSKGIALGIVDPKQIAAIRNASRFISTTMTESNCNSVVSDNRKTYHQNQSVTVNVDSLAVRDTQDIYALALEIDALKRRMMRGKGG